MNCISNLARKNLKFSKTKNILVIITIALATCLITASGIVIYSIQNMVIASTEEQSGNYHGIYKNVNDRQIEILKNNIKIESAGEYIPFESVKRKNSNYPDISLIYADFKAADMTNIKLEKGRLPQKSTEIALEKWVLEKLDVKSALGETIHIEYGNTSSAADFVLSGILKDSTMHKQQNLSTGLVSKKFVYENLPNVKKDCFVRIKNHRDVEKSITDVGHSIGIKDKNIVKNSMYIDASGGDPMMLAAFAVIAVIVVLTTVVVIYNIFYISVIERIKQFGLLAAVGATRKQIRKIIFREGLLLSVVGIPLGIILAHIAVFMIGYLFSQISNIRMKSSPYIVIVCVFISLAAVAISLIKPGRLSSKISPVESMKYSGVKISSSKKERASLKKISIAKIARLNLWRNKKRTIMTMLSLTMSGVLFIIMCSVLKSMNVDNMVKHDFKYEFDLSVTNTYGSPLNKKLIDDIKSMDGVKNVYIKKNTLNVFVDNARSILYGYDDYMLNRLNKYLIRGNISSENLKNRDEVLIVGRKNEDGSVTCKYKVGDKIPISIRAEDSSANLREVMNKEFTVAGILSDNIAGSGWIVGGYEFITHEDVFTKKEFKDSLADNRDNKLTDIYIDIDSSKFEAIKSRLKAIVNRDSRIMYESNTDWKKELENQFMAIEITAMSFTGIIALIGILNLINTMITSILTRKREYGMLQAVGLSNKQLRQMLQIEGMYYAGISSLLSVIFGTGLGYFCFKLFKKAGADYAEYEFPLISILAVIVVFILLEILITYLIEGRLKKESIIDRIRYSE